MSTEEQIKLALAFIRDARVNTSGLGAPINILKCLLEDLESKPENNWIAWLQARIPSLKESHNVYWLKQAMEGYKKDSKQIQIEPDFQKVLHEAVFENMRDKPLKNRVSELDKDKMTENLENMLGNLSSQSGLPNAWKYLINGYDGIVLKVEDAALWMEDYANLCVEQAKVKWEEEKRSYLCFAHFDYESQGGFGDLKGCFTNIDEAITICNLLHKRFDTVEIVDSIGILVWENGKLI